MQKFKNIFFDLGGVLFNIDLPRTLMALAELGVSIPVSADDGKPLRGLPVGEHPIFQLIAKVDVGEVRREQFLEIMHGICRPDVTDEQIIDAYCTMISVPTSRLALVKRLREKYNVFLLSNIGDVHWDYVLRVTREAGYPMDECFDHCFCSFQLGVSKPDPAIFQRVIEESGVVPGESLYIDDFDDNIKAGAEAGLLAYKIDGNTLEQHVPLLFEEEMGK
ncbi:MAG: HAD-IA family hydrolase [Bacteroidales bacterium]|nr:HAD-IA family hydrolase [Bacteroidales bacterium]